MVVVCDWCGKDGDAPEHYRHSGPDLPYRGWQFTDNEVEIPHSMDGGEISIVCSSDCMAALKAAVDAANVAGHMTFQQALADARMRELERRAALGMADPSELAALRKGGAA